MIASAAHGKHVVHVTSAHPWTDNRIHYRECASLIDAGYSVLLIAVDSPNDGPHIGARLIRLPPRPRLRRMLVGAPHALLLAIKSGALIVHLHDPELIPAIPLLRFLRRIVIFDSHEDIPDDLDTKSYLPPLVKPFLRILGQLLVRTATLSSGVISATERIAERFPDSVVVHNYPPLRPEEIIAASAVSRPKAVVYVGGLTELRGSRVMMSVLSHELFPPEWHLELAGSGARELAVMQTLPGWTKVNFHGQVAPATARDLILNSRIGLLLLQDCPAHRTALPTKLFEYLAAGVPVIASDFPLWKRIIVDHDCGVLVDQASPSEVAKAVRRYADDPDLLTRHSTNARQLAETTFNWSNESNALVAFYDRLSRAGKPR